MSTAEAVGTSAEFPGSAESRRGGSGRSFHHGGESEPAVDPQLIAESKQQIRTLVNEIAQLTQSDAPLDEFYDGFLSRVVSALASLGGAIWTKGEQGEPKLHFQINLPQRGLVDDEAQRLRHSLLLARLMSAGEPYLAPPRSGPADDDEAGNPTDYLLILCPLKIGHEVRGLVEIFQRPGGGPTTHRGYLRFLVQMCDLANDYLKSRRLKHFSDRQSQWEQLEQFLRAVHSSLDSRETTSIIANEGRRLLGCDRVSVALRSGAVCRVETVSGLDAIDRRAADVQRLSRLASKVVAAGEPLWYAGADEELPPQIEEALHEYIDRSHAKVVAVLPLERPVPDADANRSPPELLGALIIEQLHDGRLSDSLMKRAEVVADHSAAALANAIDHSSLFLLPLWRTLGKATHALRGSARYKTLGIAGAVALLVGALVAVPADFEMSSRGTLRPQTRREIYAGVSGVLDELPVEHGEMVAAGDVLARLRNTDLEFEMAALIGKKTTTQQQILATQRALLHSPRRNPDDENRLSGELAQLRETAESIEQQLVLYREKERQLTITSPEAGQVVTWQVRDLLLHRPVERGQNLLTVVDPEGEWELELRVPERRMGHVTVAHEQSPRDMRVTFVLATHPGEKFEGRVIEIDRTASVRDDDGNTVLIRVSVDISKLPELRDGSLVTARLHCGRRPLGYVLFHEVLETVQAKILFWL